MATSESDGDFESADEELGRGTSSKKNVQATYWTSPSAIDSESDDDTEYVQRVPYNSSNLQNRSGAFLMTAMDVATGREIPVSDMDNKNDCLVKAKDDINTNKSRDCVKKTSDIPVEDTKSTISDITVGKDNDSNTAAEDSDIIKSDNVTSEITTAKVETSFSSEKKDNINTKIMSTKDEHSNKGSLFSIDQDVEYKLQKEPKVSHLKSDIDDLPEMDIPEELKSNKKFKEIFEPEGWEGLDDDIELPDELTEDKLQPILDKISSVDREPEKNWSSWGNWGMTSLINTATASVSTLTNHVSQGLTLLENTIGVSELADTRQDEVVTNDGAEQKTHEEEGQTSYSSFGFGNLMSGVSSITKLVESTGSKVMTGGLDTLEAIGKKTMEVLQDGDPGLKKKRAFFMNEANKPILSQILREAKEKAETEEKTLEERELARKIHFESLFDDYQGLVHLEALEMLSKQSNMKIQQYLIGLDTNDLTSIQETLEEIKELCDLGDEDEEDNNQKDLKNRLEEACHDLGVNISYEKLYTICTETENYLTLSLTHADQEIFQNAISTLAQFTAFSVERFHKTAELLLIKERHSTINETDALVQLTNILTNQISSLANLFCNVLNQRIQTLGNSDNISANVTTIFLEAANANSYIQDAFRLLVPILQVGAI